MPSTSKLALPHPDTTSDANVPADMKALAQKVDDVLAAGFVQSGTVTVTVPTGATGSQSGTPVSFSRAYASSPSVTATVGSTGDFVAYYTSKSAAGVTLQVVHRLGLAASSARTITVDWQAVGPI